MGTSKKYSPDLWVVSKQLPSWMRLREEAGASPLQHVQGHASFNTKTEDILALPLNLQAEMNILGGRNALDQFCISKRVCGLPIYGGGRKEDPKTAKPHRNMPKNRKPHRIFSRIPKTHVLFPFSCELDDLRCHCPALNQSNESMRLYELTFHEVDTSKKNC